MAMFERAWAFMTDNVLAGIDSGVSDILDPFLVLIVPFHC